jgi:hypothetical protein
MKNPSPPSLPLSDGSGVTDAVRVQILATEHWSLLATRSMTWNEAFTLAFIAQATAFGEAFRLFAFVALPVVLFLGIGTYARLSAINDYDFWLTVGMNRLRHAYLDLAPELEPYFITGHNDDIAGIWQSYSPDWLLDAQPSGSTPFNPALFFTSTPYIIGAINALVAGVLVALVAEALGASVAVSAIAGAVGGILLLAALLAAPARRVAHMRRHYQPRFPTT